MNAVKSKMHN